MNDIENDPMYRSWPAGVQELLRATFPGVIRQIRRNFFNLVSAPKARTLYGDGEWRRELFFPPWLRCYSDRAGTLWMILIFFVFEPEGN